MKIMYLILGLFTLLSCSNIDKKDLTVINNIPLGITKKQYEDTIFSMSERAHFQTKTFYSTPIELQNDIISGVNTLKLNITKVLDPKMNDGFDYYGALVPIYFTGTENLVGEHVLIFRDQPLIVGTVSNVSEKSKIYGYRQFIRKEVISHIQDMLINKYGEPTKKTTEKNYPAYLLDTNIQLVNSTAPGELLVWEKDNMTINFFKGFHSKQSTYDYNMQRYFETLGGDLDQKKNVEYTFDLPYINYKLNQNTITKLKLDNIAL